MKMTTADLFATPSTITVAPRGKKSVSFVKAVGEDDNAYQALNKSLMSLDGEEDQPKRLAFEVDPITNRSVFASLYRPKQKGLSDTILKRLSVQASIVASIVNARGNQVSAFGRPQPDRFSTGYKIEPEPTVVDKMSDDEKADLRKRIVKAESLIATCGKPYDANECKDLSFSQYLFMTTRNALIFGRIATEAIPDGEDKFHSFRPIDAGTIYYSMAQKDAADNVRRQAQNLLAQLKLEKPSSFIDSKGRNVDELFGEDEYAWVQVINDRPVQFFTAKECLVHNFYPVTDVEQVGYPLTPLDTIVSDVTTFINITTHNRLFFQSGRASRGAVVVQSNDIDDIDLQHIRQQFQANINGVGNSWRTPLFKVGKDDKVDWFSIDSNARDMEFQYLSDSNARTILSGFQMSPEELSGYSHLSKGTASQALSECFDPSSYLWTDAGLKTATQLLSGQQEKSLRVWTGTNWQDARVFCTGEKALTETHVDGYSIKTSPDHRFRVLSNDGELVWKKQQDLFVGDQLLLNAKPVAGSAESIPSFRGQKLSLEMMELLGWMTGDGSLVAPKARCGGYVKLFYHSVREREIWGRHVGVLESFGLTVKHHEHLVDDEERTSIQSKNNFASVAATRITNVVYDTELVKWLHELGCGYSAEGKTIPPIFYVLPVEYRQAFLRGLFSADGHVPTSGAVVLTIQDGRTREQVRQMLLGLGIRTLGCDGILRESFGEKAFSHKLFIKDRNEFWEQIGFIQPHKVARRKFQKFARGAVPLQLASKLLAPVLKSDVFAKWDRKAKDNIRGCAGVHATPRCITWRQLRSVLEQTLGSAPSWLTDYHIEPVTALTEHPDKIQMVDVEVFDAQHAQILQGFQVHNSNTEYQLEAHRDTGIRPLLWQMQSFINQRILPLIDAELAKICTFKFVGLDAETAEKETTRLQTDATVHMTYDQILQKVEKKTLGAKWGGNFPLNPAFQQILDRYMTVGQILEGFFGVEGAGKDPRLDYRRDEYWFRQVDILNQKQQFDQQAQIQAQQAQQQVSQPGQPVLQGSGAPQGDQQSAPQPAPDQTQNAPQQPAQPQQDPNQPDLSTGIDQLAGILNKSESQLPTSKRHLLAQQRLFISHAMSALEEESKKAIKEIAGIAKKHIAPTK